MRKFFFFFFFAFVCLSTTFMEIQSRESCFWERGQNMSGGIGLRAVTNKQWLRDDYGLIEFHAWRQMSRASLVSVVAFAASELHRSRRRHSHRRRHLGVLWGNNAPFHLLHENERLWGIRMLCYARTIVHTTTKTTKLCQRQKKPTRYESQTTLPTIPSMCD